VAVHLKDFHCEIEKKENPLSCAVARRNPQISDDQSDFHGVASPERCIEDSCGPLQLVTLGLRSPTRSAKGRWLNRAAYTSGERACQRLFPVLKTGGTTPDGDEHESDPLSAVHLSRRKWPGVRTKWITLCLTPLAGGGGDRA
jgi:hypothetical protein